ncbi:MAG: sigma-70 family RNA polymerase sigma factor [Rubripirellula sp.]
MSSHEETNEAPSGPLSEGDFMRLLMQHEPALRAFARSLLPDWHAVDEVIQEASMTLWQKFAQLDSESGFLPWAKVIVRFKCLSAISVMRRNRHVFSEGVLELLANEAAAIDSETHDAARTALRSCLNQFSQPHQELLLAPYAGDGRVRTLAEQKGKSANALYKLLGRLRGKLSLCIERNIQTT